MSKEEAPATKKRKSYTSKNVGDPLPSTSKDEPSAKKKIFSVQEVVNMLQEPLESDDDIEDVDSEVCITSSSSASEEEEDVEPPQVRRQSSVNVTVDPFSQEKIPQHEGDLLPSIVSRSYYFDPTPNPGIESIPFTGEPGLNIIPPDNSPAGFFNYFLTNEFYAISVECSNKYGEELAKSTSKTFAMKNFKNISREEFNTFLGLFFHMGSIKLPKINDYWRTDFLYKYETFSACMSRKRFLQILRALHFSSLEKSNDDRQKKIRPLMNLFNDSIDRIYEPGKELSIDESMVLWRGRLIFKQFIKVKRHKYGVKLYMLTEPSGLILKFLIYMGGSDTLLGGKGHADKVVLNLLKGKLGKGHALYIDNYYTNIPLIDTLRKSNTYATGTLRSNRKHIPKEISEAKLQKGDVMQLFSEENICVLKWKDKREIMISSEHDGSLKQVSPKKFKPVAVTEYNQFMGGVDRQHQLMEYYCCERKTLRWYKKIGLHIYQMMLLNSYLFFKMQTKRKMSFIKFRDEVVLSLVRPNMDSTISPSNPRIDSRNVHLPFLCPKTDTGRTLKRKCRVCSKEKRIDSNYYCPKCPEEPGLCLQPCFGIFHNYN